MKILTIIVIIILFVGCSTMPKEEVRDYSPLVGVGMLVLSGTISYSIYYLDRIKQ